MPRALITGVTGQDGSYLAELLLAKGYEVIGVVRRTSHHSYERIEHLLERIEVVAADLLDQHSLTVVLQDTHPDEVYNLAAQSYVPTSWTQPVLTGEFTALGVTRILEAIRLVHPTARFYQASSSEMFGRVTETPQRETTSFYPRSPYGVAKVYGHWITVNYRESYGLHATSGILFNHESVTENTPVVIRRDGLIDVEAIGALIPYPKDGLEGGYVSMPDGHMEVWDGEDFVRCTARTAHWHEGASVVVHGRGGIVETTPDHVVFTKDSEREAQAIEAGDDLRLASQPPSTLNTVLTEDEAWLLGILAADGSVLESGQTRITCHDDAVLSRAAVCWERVAAGTSRKYDGAASPFSGRKVPTLRLNGNGHYRRMLRSELYSIYGHKKVPIRVLNAAPHLQLAFLDGYNQGDGLKAGHGTDPFKAFRTTSPVLAAGLTWLARTALGRRVSLYRQPGALGGGDSYLINLTSGNIPGRKGAHLRKPQEEVRKVDRRSYRGWMCDLATDTGRFAAGPGLVVVHNSPRRGLEFVTRKISHTVAQIKLGLATELRLGNLEAQRDWGYAGDYVEAMWQMLQQDEPGTYVISTGETHSVREFCQTAFEHVGLNWEDHVVQDEKFMRPAEVDLLVGDSSLARATLGWKPKVDFESLVKLMVDADLDLLSGRLRHIS